MFDVQTSQASRFIDDDELVEVTPTSVRLRKKLLTENERRRESRKARLNRVVAVHDAVSALIEGGGSWPKQSRR